MSAIQKVKSRAKEGVNQLQSLSGIKKVAVYFGMGYAIGTIVDLFMEFIMTMLVYPLIDEKNPDGTYVNGIGHHTRLEGITIYPNHYYTNEAGEEVGFMHYDDILLLIVTILMLASKKLWLVLGFFFGWYFSSYLGLYNTFNLPKGERDLIPEG